MSRKFVPNGDSDFALMAETFAFTIARNPAKYLVSEPDCALLRQRVQAYRDALANATRRSTRTASTVALKDEARKAAEEIVRRIANEIRVSGRISAVDKVGLRIKERPKKLGKRTVPFAAPVLQYMGAPPKAGPNCGRHRLHFSEGFQLVGRSKPNGAVRVELFVDLVAMGEPVPQFPGQYLGGRPWYLRSFARSPITVQHPQPPVPMLVVYWARWADAHGNVGPFSQTCVTRVEGWSTGTGVNHLLGPMPDVKQLAGDPKYITTITQLRQIEQVTVQPLLTDSSERAGAAGTPAPKQLPTSDAA